MAQDPAAVWLATARRQVGDDYPRAFAARFDTMAAQGRDVHGEADFLAGLLPGGASVLDAGCGTGRVAARLADLGFRVVGADLDPAMIAVARERRPELEWHVGDLATLDLGVRFDAVAVCGNVIPFIAVHRLPAAADALARHITPGGPVVCGFGLDADHLPPGAPAVPLAAYHAACAGAGLVLEATYAGWDGSPFEDHGYAVSVHRGAEGAAGQPWSPTRPARQ